MELVQVDYSHHNESLISMICGLLIFGKPYWKVKLFCLYWHVVARRLRAPNLSSGVSDQLGVGSTPGLDMCVLCRARKSLSL